MSDEKNLRHLPTQQCETVHTKYMAANALSHMIWLDHY